MSVDVAPVKAPRLGVGRVLAGLKRVPLVPLVVVVVVLLPAILGPYLAPYSPTDVDLSNPTAPPLYHPDGQWAHPLGTDELGRDILSRLLFGYRISPGFALIVLVIGGTIGTALGLVSGYTGGIVDAAIQRFTEAVLSIPMMMIALVLVFVLGQSFVGVMVVLTPFIVVRFTRMVRGDVLNLRNQDYVLLAQVAGASTWRILRRHILPNVTSTIIVMATLDLGTLILLESSLSFLGVGAPPPTPSWGLMVAGGREYIATKYWISAFPGLAILITVFSVNWLGDWLRDVLDPRWSGS